mgnify:CR=1 FL=1
MLALKIILFTLAVAFFVLYILIDNLYIDFLDVPQFWWSLSIGTLIIAILLCFDLFFISKIVLALISLITLILAIIYFYDDDTSEGIFCLIAAILLGLGSVIWFTNFFGIRVINKSHTQEIETPFYNSSIYKIEQLQDINKKLEPKDIKKAQHYDLQQLEKLSAKKISKQELLVQTKEPVMYVIAPMTYDTKQFEEDNSNDSAMFGFKTVDNSVARLGLLENCITDFENNVDEITGVSFLDRSKISQIEKEHKFQLGDWSNDKKTAEVGKALNANILLFLDKFTYVDSGSGQYRFVAKFVDVNTMQSSSFVVAYKNPKKEIVTPDVISQISFRNFTKVSTKNDSFRGELYLGTQNVIRTVQKKDMKMVSPLGAVTKLQTSEFDVNTPKTEFANASSINFDGFGELELDLGSEKKSYSYTFDANEIFIERNEYNFYTDGKIGVLTVKTDDGYEKFDVFTNNNREYYLRLGSVELEKAFVNYYLQMIKQ